jgi:site-specific DNA-methyltransferase (adenine-specific)
MEAMKEMDDNQFDLAIVDPPYRKQEQNKPTSWMRQNNAKQKMRNFGDKPNKEYFSELSRISKNQIIWGANYFIEHLSSSEGMIFWYKCEGNKLYSDGELAWTSYHKRMKQIKINPRSTNEDKIHPTQKPVKLYEWILINYANEGDKILDTHLGSGSIAIACHNLGFDLTGYEIDEEYFSAAVKRYQQHKNQLRIF